MEIPEAEINEHGVAVNWISLRRWGDDKSFYEIRAAKYQGKILTGYEMKCGRDPSRHGMGGGPSLNSTRLVFKSVKAAIAYHKKHAIESSKNEPADNEIIRAAIAADEQLELFG
ncbi:MAG: hypothetical protein PQJ59_01730 [Spirochaetales bacterium]|nr:hypothetical protein [Spirochaetales bacterium]